MDDLNSLLIIGLVVLMGILILIVLIQNTFENISITRLNNYEGNEQIMLDLKRQTQLNLVLRLTKFIIVLSIVALLIKLSVSALFYGLLFGCFTLVEILGLVYSKVDPEKTMIRLYPAFKVLKVILWPLSLIVIGIYNLFSSFIKPKVDTKITEEELLTYIEEAESEGSFLENDTNLIRRSIEFNDLLVEEVLKPRVDMVALDVDWSLEKIKAVMDENEYSRYPIYQDSIDTIIGVIHSKDFKSNEINFNLKSIIKPVLFVPESYKISKLLKQFQLNKSHLAIVIDEYGGTAGLVTLEDIVEELVGEIWDEHDDITLDITRLNQHQWIVLGQCELDKFCEFTQYDIDEDEFESSTVGGWVVEILGKIPTTHQEIIHDNMKITVLEADEKKVLKVLVNRNED